MQVTELILLGILGQGNFFNLIIRVFTSIMYGGEVFSAHDYWFWIPMLVPYLGGAIGSYIYYGCVGLWNK